MIYIKLAFSFVTKIVTFKKGALLFVSALTSTGLTYYMNMLLTGVDKRDILIALVVELAFLSLFMVFTTIDLVTGIQAAFHVNRYSPSPLPTNQVIQSSKLWRTFWKSFGIVVLTLLLTFLTIFTALVKSGAAFWVAIWTLVCFWIMTCGFEFYSIGENIAKRNNGRKAPIFNFVDKLLDALQRKAIRKIDGSSGNDKNEEE